MKTMTKLLVLAALTLVCVSSSYAVPPAYYGPMGNAEEHALRAYKWLWRGMKALAYRPAKGLREGNLKTPVLGTVEVLKGVRQGIIEFDESVFLGLIGTAPPGPGDYKRLRSVNVYIELEPLFNAIANGGFKLLLERYPLTSEEERQAMGPKTNACAEECSDAGENDQPVSDEKPKPSRHYLGNHAPEKADDQYTGNMLRTLR